MEIKSVFDKSFAPYGAILDYLDTKTLLERMDKVDYREGVSYEPSMAELEEDPIFDCLRESTFGGMPIEIGLCWGHNTKLNCLEYHRDSEINIGIGDFILLLSKKENIVAGKLDTSTVQAFWVPGGVAVEVYATSLHYAPCSARKEEGFKVAIVLPKGTNEERPDSPIRCYEDSLMTARNKWLLAHSESSEAENGAVVALTGDNIDIKNLI